MALLDYKYDIGNIIQCKNQKVQILEKSIGIVSGRNRRFYTYKCLKCGYINTAQETCLIHQCGCPCCDGQIVVKGINDIPTTDPWMVDYFQGGYEEACQYTHGSTKKIIAKCPVCGTIQSKPIIINHIYANHSCGCKCSKWMSFPEQVMYNILTQLGENFIYQYTKENASWVGDYRYDFYIPKHNLLIEINGKQHYYGCFKGKSYETEILRDSQKRKLALDNNVKLIELDCRKSDIYFILNSIQNSYLSELYDLSCVKINELFKSIMSEKYELCKKYLQDNPYIKVSQLSEKLQMSNYVVRQILKAIELHPIFLGSKGAIDVYYDNEYKYTFGSYCDMKRRFSEIFNTTISVNKFKAYRDTNKVFKKHFTFKTHKFE